MIGRNFGSLFHLSSVLSPSNKALIVEMLLAFTLFHRATTCVGSNPVSRTVIMMMKVVWYQSAKMEDKMAQSSMITGIFLFVAS